MSDGYGLYGALTQIASNAFADRRVAASAVIGGTMLMAATPFDGCFSDSATAEHSRWCLPEICSRRKATTDD
jgi:hypothetical protein